jgi:hypothetical protein
MGNKLVERLYEAREEFIKRIEGAYKNQVKLLDVPTYLDKVKEILESTHLQEYPDGAVIDFESTGADNIEMSRVLVALLYKAGVDRAIEDPDLADIPRYAIDGDSGLYVDNDGFIVGWGVYTWVNNEYWFPMNPEASFDVFDPEQFDTYCNQATVKIYGFELRVFFDEDIIAILDDQAADDLIDALNEASDKVYDVETLVDDLRSILGGVRWVKTDAWRGHYSSPPDHFEAFGLKWEPRADGFVSLDGYHGDDDLTEEELKNQATFIMVSTRTSNCCAAGLDVYYPMT